MVSMSKALTLSQASTYYTNEDATAAAKASYWDKDSNESKWFGKQVEKLGFDSTGTVKNEDFLFCSALASNIINTWVSNINFDLKNELLLPAFLQEVGKFIISEVIQKNRKSEEFLIELEETKDTTFCEKKFTGYTCARITANIFKQWNISPNIIIPIAFTENIESCPNEFKTKAQILEIIKILCDIRYPLSDRNIHKALEKVSLYGFDIEHFVNSIDVIKEVINQNS